MRLRVQLGRPDDGRADALLDAALAGRELGGYWHIVRTSTRARALAGRVLRARGVVLDAPVVTLPDLVRRAARRRAKARRQLSPEERALLIDELARQHAQEPLRGTAGLDAWLGGFFSTLKQADVFTRDRALETFPSLRRQDAGTAEALRLFGLYQDWLVRRDLYDEDGLYLEVARDLGTPELPFDRALGPHRRQLVIEGFYQCNLVERAVFARLFQAFDDVQWLIDLPSCDAGTSFGFDVFADLSVGGSVVPGDLSWLRAAGADVAAAATPARPPSTAVDDDDPLRWLDPATAQRLELISATDVEEEARFCAERTATLLAADPEAQIVVVCPSDREAAPALTEAFADTGVPLIVAARVPLRDTPLAHALLELFDIAARGFTRTRLVAFLRNLPRAACSLGDASLTAAAVDAVSRAAGIVGGRDEWPQRLDRHVAALSTEVGALPDGAPREKRERELAEATAVTAGVRALMQRLPHGTESMTTDAFANALAELVAIVDRRRLGHAEPLGDDPFRQRGEALSARTARALDGVVETYRRAAALTGEAARPFERHATAVRALIDAVDVAPGLVPARGVRLLGLREIRGVAADHVIVIGVTESDLLRRSPPLPLVDEAEAARAGLRTAALRVREVNHLLVQALAAGRRSVTLVRPERELDCESLPAAIWETLVDRAGFRPTRASDWLERSAVHGRATAAAIAGRRVAATSLQSPPDDQILHAAWARFAAVGGDLGGARARARAEAERRSTLRVGRFEGVLEPAALVLLGQRLGMPRPVMSVSRLDEYVECPLRYFYKRVLRLEPEAELDRELTPMERGTLVHEILFNFHLQSPPTDDATTRARKLDQIAAHELAARGRDDVFSAVFSARLRSGLLDPGETKGILRLYLDLEAARGTGFTPMVFEARFGDLPNVTAPATVVSTTPVPLTLSWQGRQVELRLTGSIDRVDIRERGGVCEAFIIDYKTGRTAEYSTGVKRGQKFQLPLYARVAPALLGSRCNGRPVRVVGVGFYQLHEKAGVDLTPVFAGPETIKDIIGTKEHRNRAMAEGDFERLVEAYGGRAAEMLLAIGAGRFHPTRDEGSCKFCDFAGVCRGNGEAQRLESMTGPELIAQSRVLLGGDEEASA